LPHRQFVAVPTLALAALAAAAPAPAQAPAAAGAAFERFFTGITEGSGMVKMVLTRAHAMRDRAKGQMERGVLVLDQVVEEEGKPPRRRIWRLVRSGANGVSGTISDAKGPVTGSATGSTLHLKYRMAEGPSVEQWITLQPGGRAATNRMTFHKFGLKVATVASTIRKVD
jgi:hypothetical protein